MRPITQEKLDDLTKFMEKEAIDAILISDWENGRDVNMRYLTGHPMDATMVVLTSGEICLVPWDLQLAEDHEKVDIILDF
ncbi:MAG: aminopeptidase P family N-terminal domain-containing protein, partial [Candidatus Heimdallarchaeota archaeon]